MRTITISITVPDGVEVRVEQSAPIPDDFEHEPLPPFQGVDEHFDDIAGQAPVGIPQVPPFVEAPPSVRRGIAVQQQPIATASFAWQEGMKHDQAHKPLKAGARGLFCPTKLGKGPQGDVWCQWKAA